MTTTDSPPRGAWAAPVLAGLVLALSAVAPFVRFGDGVPSVGGADVVAAALSVAAWAPFVAALAWLGRRAPGRGAWLGGAVLLLVAPPLHTLLFAALMGIVAGGVPPAMRPGGPVFLVFTLLGALQFLVVLAVAEARRAARAAAGLALEHAWMEAELTKARLDALRAQLEPHFLFNTLNSVAVLAPTDPAGAQAMVRRLSELLRAVLADDAMTVPLRRELELLEAYVDIQRVRFGDRLRVTAEVDADALECRVPTLVLQPLVENAIRHAVERREGGGHVRVRGRVDRGRVLLDVTDDGPDAADEPPPAGGFGVGLRNTASRLGALYGAAHALRLTRPEQGGCAVRLELPAR
ncbi:histidine kinase [Roseisolibacter sp. H3M3-2]|uniref:sensor histidine kinase n=1 Tax=Roseisolibacter sp. H3M3-2 TaxID=3031323 RepID=UPI0023DABA22|nr:histidine kinase [Roseisolibacter sp. H3M3-2]MDF1501920.1 histidine kinase [Roseisolibacter sp. H3M3-2]